MIIDHGSACMSSLMSYFFPMLNIQIIPRLNIKIKAIGTYNHQTLQAEHGIKFWSNRLIKHLVNLKKTVSLN